MNKNLFVCRGGMRVSNPIFGELNITYPFAILYIKNNNLTLKWNFIFIRREFPLRFNEIIGVKIRKGIISIGIEFVHNNKQLPDLIIFWTRRYDEIFNILERKGIRKMQ